MIFVVGVTFSNDGTEIFQPSSGTPGQPQGSAFPLCDFDPSNVNIAFYQQFYSYPYNNAGSCNTCPVPSSNNQDAFIQCFRDHCGNSCRMESPDDPDLKNMLSVSGIFLFPNPTENSFTIYCSLAFDNTELKVYNDVGSVILTDKIISGNSYKVNLTNYPAGIYFVRVGNKTAKIIRQ